MASLQTCLESYVPPKISSDTYPVFVETNESHSGGKTHEYVSAAALSYLDKNKHYVVIGVSGMFILNLASRVASLGYKISVLVVDISDRNKFFFEGIAKIIAASENRLKAINSLTTFLVNNGEYLFKKNRKGMMRELWALHVSRCLGFSFTANDDEFNAVKQMLTSGGFVHLQLDFSNIEAFSEINNRLRKASIIPFLFYTSNVESVTRTNGTHDRFRKVIKLFADEYQPWVISSDKNFIQKISRSKSKPVEVHRSLKEWTFTAACQERLFGASNQLLYLLCNQDTASKIFSSLDSVSLSALACTSTQFVQIVDTRFWKIRTRDSYTPDQVTKVSRFATHWKEAYKVLGTCDLATRVSQAFSRLTGIASTGEPYYPIQASYFYGRSIMILTPMHVERTFLSPLN